MKTSIRVLAPVLLAASFLGLAGCGADNDTAAQQLQTSQGAPPPTTVKGGDTPTQVNNIQDYAKRRQEQQQNEGVAGSYAKSQGVRTPKK
jgi:hypothetical protein